MHSKSGVRGKRLCKGHPESLGTVSSVLPTLQRKPRRPREITRSFGEREWLTKYQVCCVLVQVCVFDSELPLEVDLPIWHSLRVYKEEHPDLTWQKENGFCSQECLNLPFS